MVVLVTCMNGEEPIKNEGTKSGHNIINQFLRCSRAANSIIGDGILTEFKLIQAYSVLLICKNEYDLLKNESTRVVTTFLPLQVYGDFLRSSRAANSLVQGLI